MKNKIAVSVGGVCCGLLALCHGPSDHTLETETDKASTLSALIDIPLDL